MVLFENLDVDGDINLYSMFLCQDPRVSSSLVVASDRIVPSWQLTSIIDSPTENGKTSEVCLETAAGHD